MHSQVALIDAEADSYPQWETGEEPAVFGAHGVAVTTANDEDVEIIVCAGDKLTGYLECARGEIEVGHQGVLVGGILTEHDTFAVSWPPGPVAITIYVDAPRREARTIVFVLQEPSPVSR